MPIFTPEPVEERGKKDARRHRDKQKDILKERLPEIIANEDIITGNRKGRVVKIRIRSLDIPHFRPSKDGDGEGVGVGQGEGEEGDEIGRRPNPEDKGPGAGDEPGVDYIETEIEIEEAIQMMLEDLGLPNLQDKDIKEFLVSLGMEIKGLDKVGPQPLLDRKATAKEGIKRFWHFLESLKSETGRDELTCFDALKKAEGLLDDALKLLADPAFKAVSEKVEPFAIIYHDDQRYLRIEESQQPESRAVLIAIMDVSGSMDDNKKYLARSTLFWISEYLRYIYKRMDIRFIIYHSTAKMVDEYEFFHTGESGGTITHTAYQLAGELIDKEYPTSDWNVYIFHFSDGDDMMPTMAVNEAQKLLDRKINMLAYGEVDVPVFFGTDGRLLKKFLSDMDGVEQTILNDGRIAVIGGADTPFLGMRIKDKDDILPCIKEFLNKTRWQ